MNLHNLDSNTLISIIESLDSTICSLREELSEMLGHHQELVLQLRDANTNINILQNKVTTLSDNVLKRFENAVDNDVRTQLDALFAENHYRNKIAMIKLLRESTKAGLCECKEAIESWYNFEPYIK